MNRKWYLDEHGNRVKKCARCQNVFIYTSENFYQTLSGHFSSYCISCDSIKSKEYKRNHKKTNQVRSNNNVFVENNKEYRKCSKCKKSFLNTFEYFDRSNHGQGGFRSDCRKCRLEYNREYSQKRWAYQLYLNARNSSKVNGYEINITEEFILDLFTKQNKKCFWLGIKMIPSKNKKNPFQPSLDRIDRNKGYLVDNVVLCCFSANFGRNENSEEDWKMFLENLQHEMDYSQWKK